MTFGGRFADRFRRRAVRKQRILVVAARAQSFRRGAIIPVALASQEHIGPYRLLNIVKTGQTSQVWAVMSDRDQRRLALKILLSDFRKDREHVGYMKQEAIVGKTLDHPRVIKIFEFATDHGFPYLVMEYFPAPNMKEIILQVREQVAYLIPKIIDAAAEGLAHFNSQGWIHRDVKPDNFLIIQNGDVKLIDFALAQRKKGALGRLFGGRSKVQGTRSYMSPEQIRGEPLDERSDIYSFGCTIFHLVAGRPPYTGSNSNELLNKHLRAQLPSVEAHDRNLTSEFGDLIRATMAKNPKSRPETMGKFLNEFRTMQMFKRPPAAPASVAAEENAS
jgi:serine/threonine protein kinase